MSLRLRLVAATCLVAAVALTSAGVAIYTVYSHSQMRQIDDTLQRSHEPIEELVIAGGDQVEPAVERAAPGMYVAVIGASGVTVSLPARQVGNEPLEAELDDLTVPEGAALDGGPDRPTFSVVHAVNQRGDLRVRTSRLSDGSTLVIGLPLAAMYESRRHLVIIESLVAAIALAIAGVLAWFLVSVGLRPLRRVEHTALAIAEGGDLDREVPGSDRSTEVGRVAVAVNTMLGRIRAAFAERDATELELRRSEKRMRRFVADVSHELRTPLAALGAYAELFERGARNHPDDLERSLRGIALETARMHELVEELLLLAHLDEGRPLAADRVDLNEVLLDAIAAARAVSSEWPITLRASAVDMVVGDAGRLRQVFDNLLANVRKHTPRGTATTVTIGADEHWAVIMVRDNGPGMTAEQAERMFERFFRADPSRSRQSGGAGLGMAIVHALVSAHGGTIDIDTAPGAGLAVTIRLPLAGGEEE